MKTLKPVKYNDSSCLYAFEHDGVEITNPLVSEDGIFPVSPEHYGFKVTTTGGNCTAHYQKFLLDGQEVVMLLTDGNLNKISTDTIEATVGLFDVNFEELEGKTWAVNR